MEKRRIDFKKNGTSQFFSIALMGTRGVPAKYGGFETCVEEVGRRLAQKGHHVVVYCRKSYYKTKRQKYKGMKLVYLPNIPRKSLDTLSHSFLTCLHALFTNYDIYMVFNSANSLFALFLRLFGKKVIINTDGLEWKRSKWGFWGRSFYRVSEKIACLAANRLVCDSKGMREYYKEKHGMDSTEIAYGAYVYQPGNPRRLYELNLRPNGYFLQITRFEPENHPLMTIKAFKKLSTSKKLVIVGGVPYQNEYSKKIEEEANEDIILPGFVYDEELLKELWCLSFSYIHGNSVGGTNPALLQSMASACFTIAFDNPFNRDVLAECGLFYNDGQSLLERMQWALNNKNKLNEYQIMAQKRIQKCYTWDQIANQYEELFNKVHNGLQL
jgi:glycosyltransferase involved in cell wall biosynthesis